MRNCVIVFAAAALLAIGAMTYQRSSEVPKLVENSTTAGAEAPPTSLPALRTVPRVFEPIAVDGLELRPEDLEFAQGLCVPSLPPSLSLLDHELRLWGVEQSFGDYPQSRFPDSRSILMVLTDTRLAGQVTGHSEASAAAYLTRSPYGLHVASNGRDYFQDKGLGEPHFGHLAASFGAAGVPLEQDMFTWEGERFSVRDYVTDICFRYTPTDEPEFFASAMAHYLDLPYKWTTKNGETRSLSDLISKLLSAAPGEGICFGGHVPFALTMLLRMDDSTRCLDRQDRALAENRLREISGLLTRSQQPLGTWLVWTDVKRPVLYDSDILDRISVTGHHLEWIALAPVDVRPQPAVIRRAVAGLSHDLRRIPMERLTPETQLPLTHATRALVLLSQCARSSVKD